MSKSRRTNSGNSKPNSGKPSAPPTKRAGTQSVPPRSTRTRTQKRKSTRRVLAGAVGALVLAGAISLAFFHHSSTAGYRTTTQGWVLPRLGSSGDVSLASLKGRPVIVNFFASWCTVCAGELPVFTKDAVALKGKVAVIEVNALETGNGTAFAQQYQLAQSVTAVAKDVGGSQGDGLYQSLGGTGTMPMTAFYNAQGHLISTHVGGFDAGSLASTVRQIYGVSLPA